MNWSITFFTIFSLFVQSTFAFEKTATEFVGLHLKILKDIRLSQVFYSPGYFGSQRTGDAFIPRDGAVTCEFNNGYAKDEHLAETNWADEAYSWATYIFSESRYGEVLNKDGIYKVEKVLLNTDGPAPQLRMLLEVRGYSVPDQTVLDCMGTETSGDRFGYLSKEDILKAITSNVVSIY